MAVATFGVFGTALGIVNGIIGDFSGSDSPPIVGIQIGQTVSSVDSGGTIFSLNAWNTINAFEAASLSINYVVNNGQFFTTALQDNGNGDEIEYLEMTAATEAVCIAWLKLSNIDGINLAWSGDYGRWCNCDVNSVWHHQNDFEGKHDGEFHTPKCTWLDQDHTGGIPWDSIKINLKKNSPSNGLKQPDISYNQWCGASLPSNKHYGRIQAKPDINGGCTVLHARSESNITTFPRHEVFSKYAIHSLNPAHKGGAQELCDSLSSYGADFLDPDGQYCDMYEKKLYTLCSVSDKPGCMTYKESVGQAAFYLKDEENNLQLHRKYERGFDRWVQPARPKETEAPQQKGRRWAA